MECLRAKFRLNCTKTSGEPESWRKERTNREKKKGHLHMESSAETSGTSTPSPLAPSPFLLTQADAAVHFNVLGHHQYAWARLETQSRAQWRAFGERVCVNHCDSAGTWTSQYIPTLAFAASRSLQDGLFLFVGAQLAIDNFGVGSSHAGGAAHEEARRRKERTWRRRSRQTRLSIQARRPPQRQLGGEGWSGVLACSAAPRPTRRLSSSASPLWEMERCPQCTRSRNFVLSEWLARCVGASRREDSPIFCSRDRGTAGHSGTTKQLANKPAGPKRIAHNPRRETLTSKVSFACWILINRNPED